MAPGSASSSPNCSARLLTACVMLSTLIRSLYVNQWFCNTHTQHHKCSQCTHLHRSPHLAVTCLLHYSHCFITNLREGTVERIRTNGEKSNVVGWSVSGQPTREKCRDGVMAVGLPAIIHFHTKVLVRPSDFCCLIRWICRNPQSSRMVSMVCY